jgi:aubergine-like protein
MVTKQMGIVVDDPTPVQLRDDRVETFKQAMQENINSDTTMAVFVLGSNRKDRYDAIKKFCCLERPVPSQVILAKNLRDSRKSMGVMTKVAVQMNCKLGGEIWAVSIPMSKVMICGIDTYHDSVKKSASVCAFVATVNAEKTKFFSRATLQETHQELSDNLTLSMKSAILQYAKINNDFPEKIIIYRDGISDGQLGVVLEHEVGQIVKSFQLIKPDYNPRVAFIIVKKRGNARFFQKSSNVIINPSHGTVIDNTVTRVEWYDFYLISQFTTQGTVNPTHYNVIWDTTGLKPDHLQKLSYKLTHMYYNWSGTIRVPALCQYAHKLAFLVGQSLHKEHDLSLCDKLYYL